VIVMTQYLLAVHHAGARPDLPPAAVAAVVRRSPFEERDADALLAELQDEHGAWRGAQ
jgi:hypothetical protein